MTSPTAQIHPELVDRVIELYCDWLTSCAEVRAAYEYWRDAPRSERSAAYAVYGAALDREQSACDSYAAQIRLVQARFTDAGAAAHVRTVSRT